MSPPPLPPLMMLSLSSERGRDLEVGTQCEEKVSFRRMPELGFQEQVSTLSRSGFRVGDDSPDSVIFTLDSNFSIFSSASASVDRCSFASEVHDPESDASEVPLNLFGLDGENLGSSSGPDRDPNPRKSSLVDKHSRLCGKGEKAKVQKQDLDAAIEDENQQLDSARNSFSLALRECQDRRSRSDVLSRKLDRQRPASLDLNNVAASSPRLSTMKKSMVSSRKSGTFPSPSTPDHRHNTLVMQKGWSSERVPLHNNCGRKHVNPGLLPINNGKLLPSKWEDAERWIFSPVSGDGNVRSSNPQAQRRPKSKSGPLGPPGLVHYSLYSPAMPMFEGVNMGHFSATSPFSAGVISADGLSIRSCGQGAAIPVRTEPCIARSVSVHGCSKMSGESPFTDSQGENFEEIKDAGTNVSRTVSRRDMATQMSPASSTQSSPKKRFSFSASNPLGRPSMELQSILSSKLEVRDVQVDERVTMTRWSKKHKARISGKGCVDDWKKKDKDAVVHSFAWDISDAAKSVSNSKREEARITAWENLQKAKAEAAIRKLEMKLEKKRSSSMDKIMNKLRFAQKRAQDMRSSVLANQGHQVARTSSKAISFRRNCQMSSLSGCFTCHAF